MKISECIKALQEIQNEHGDRELVRLNSSWTVSRKIAVPQLSYVNGDFFCEDSKNGHKVCRV